MYSEQPKAQHVLGVMTEALLFERPITLSYLSARRAAAGAPASTFAAHPLAMVIHRGGVYFVVDIAEDWAGRRRRLLALDRMEVEPYDPAGELFDYPDDFEIDESFTNAFGIFTSGASEQVHLRFPAKYAQYVEERTWHKDQRLERDTTGMLHLKFPVSGYLEVSDWILGMGANVEVLEPPGLRELTEERLRDALASYETGLDEPTTRPRSTGMIEWNDPSLIVKSDPARRRKYRALQSWYRQHVLELPPGEDRRGTVRASMLPESAPRSTNFLSREIFEYVEARVPVVVGEGGTLAEDRLYRNMLSSMPMCFNIFGAFRVYPITAARILAECTGLDVAALVDVQVEWTPAGAHPLGDRTAFDAWVEYRNSKNERCFFGVETKYTETFSEREYRNERYDEVTADPSSGFREGAADVLVGSKTNQLWRNVMLALAVRGADGFAEGRVLVLSLADDEGAEVAVDGVSEQHNPPQDILSHVTLEALADTASRSDALAEWASNFDQRYLRLPG